MMLRLSVISPQATHGTKNMKFEAKDILAGIVFVGGFILLGMGKDGTIASMLLTVTAFYFGHAVTVSTIKKMQGKGND